MLIRFRKKLYLGQSEDTVLKYAFNKYIENKQ